MVKIFLVLVHFISSWKNYRKATYYVILQNYTHFISGSCYTHSLLKQKNKRNFTIQYVECFQHTNALYDEEKDLRIAIYILSTDEIDKTLMGTPPVP